ncbi:MAG: hypothetical protein ACREMO_13895 [Gemmatimonadales bacterium]
MPRRLFWLAALLLAGASPLSAQLQVNAIRSLAFGTVIPGVASSVSPSDPVKSGQLQIKSATGRTVLIVFTLPTMLNGPAGATMPISFGASDAIAVGASTNNIPVTFDPRVPFIITPVSPPPRMNIFLGGKVTPATNQRAGSYSNTIVMTVTLL